MEARRVSSDQDRNEEMPPADKPQPLSRAQRLRENDLEPFNGEAIDDQWCQKQDLFCQTKTRPGPRRSGLETPWDRDPMTTTLPVSLQRRCQVDRLCILWLDYKCYINPALLLLLVCCCRLVELVLLFGRQTLQHGDDVGGSELLMLVRWWRQVEMTSHGRTDSLQLAHHTVITRTHTHTHTYAPSYTTGSFSVRSKADSLIYRTEPKIKRNSKNARK